MHGVHGEALVERYFAVTVNTHDTIDIETDLEAPMEIKTCQEWTKTEHTTTRKRRGRFVFRTHQHKKLLDTGGYYLLMVFGENMRVTRMKCIPAYELFHPSFIKNDCERVTMVWSKIFGGVE